MENKYISWLVKNKAFLSIDKIEKDIRCPSTTIHYYLAGKRGLPVKWVKPLELWVKKFLKV